MLQAAYLAKAGKRVVVLEKRHVLGGAAVTEEIIPGNKSTTLESSSIRAAMSCSFTC